MKGVIVGKTPGLSREGWRDTQDMLSSLFLSHTHTLTMVDGLVVTETKSDIQGSAELPF